ncbi:glycosyltransferase family 2 protein, partial [Clostridiaceae bacterium]|nr:glycosyltransferase family 2 protein [Clostridiaceae bacterium]
MIKVSVVIPVYNGEAYLEECMDSILFQTLKEIEVICVDDGSTDHCSELLQKYKEMDSRVKVITNQRNSGPGTSRNKGLEKARGKYVIFLDADDVFEEELLELAFSRAEIYQTDICIFREDEFSDSIKKRTEYPYSRFSIEKLEKRGVFSPKDVKDVLFNLWNGWAWDKLFLREFVL